MNISRDIVINQVLNTYNMSIGLTIYSIATFNPMEIVVGILAMKIGITNKLIIALILAFL